MAIDWPKEFAREPIWRRVINAVWYVFAPVSYFRAWLVKYDEARARRNEVS